MKGISKDFKWGEGVWVGVSQEQCVFLSVTSNMVLQRVVAVIVVEGGGGTKASSAAFGSPFHL